MSIVFLDSFDHYSTSDINRKYNSSLTASISAGTGRRGTNAMLVGTTGNIQKTIGTPTTSVIGFAQSQTSLGDFNMIELRDAGNVQLYIRTRADGKISVLRWPGTELGVSTATIAINAYHFFEVKSVIDTVVGSVQVKLDGTTILNLAGVNTQASANNYITNFRIVGGGTNRSIDDLYFDTANFLGDGACECLFVNANGNTNQWTPSAGTNYENVDDTTPDNDTTYNSEATATEIDLYNMDNLSTTSGIVEGMQVVGCLRKDDAGARNIRLMTRSGAVNYYGSIQALADAYLFYTEVWEDNPNTAAPWAIAEVNGAEIGVELNS